MLNFADPMTFEQLEHDCYKAAMAGKRVNYSDFPAVEYKYFMQLYNLYADFCYNSIDSETASKEKKKIKAQYINDKSAEEFRMSAYSEFQKNIRLSDDLICSLTKGEYSGITEAFLFAVNIITAMRDDDTTGRAIIATAKQKGLIL